jgi:general stress protein YciG
MATNQKSNSNAGRPSNSASSKTGHSNSGNFANMDESKHREISSKGGKSSNSGSSHSTGRH